MNSNLEPITVRLVLKERGWILEKFALRLAENLPNWNVHADIAAHSSPNVDVNHWMWYYDIEGKMYSRNTFFVTHVDRPAKLLLLKERLKKAELAICMSRMTVENLARYGIDRNKLCFITPAHDGLIKPRRILIGITSRLRPDKAKREQVLVNVARKIRLDDFHFEIIGRGWEKIIPQLEKAGATIGYFPGTDSGIEDYKINLQRVPNFDFFLYLGFDEGSMGLLDALAAGVPTIVTPQGFHLDIQGAITYSFSNTSQLCDVFKKLSMERQNRINSVAKLTWNEYARNHSLAWHSIVSGQQHEISQLINGKLVYENSFKDGREKRVLKELEFFFKTNPKALKEDLTKLLHWYTDGKICNTPFYHIVRSIKRFFVK